MYQEIFDFSGRPFTMAPYVRHFFEGGPVKESLDQITESISRDAGPAIVIGPHGSGKTLLLTLLSEQYQQRFKVISLSCGPMSARRDLLQAVLFELKQPYRDLSEGELRLALIDFIKPTANCQNGVLLLIDDAQALTCELVDELRLITNFVHDGLPRVRLVLCGTGRFEEVLTEPKLEPFNQRISTRCFLGNLTREQTQAYVHEHITRVGGDAATMFDQATTGAIHDVTSGCPRFINQLAEQCMIYAATHGSMVVESNMVQPAWAQVQGLPVGTPDGSPCGESSDENWTVIEFGTLEDEDSTEASVPTPLEAPTTATNESGELTSDSVNVKITGEAIDAPVIASEPVQLNSQWDDVGGSDPFVAPEPSAAQEVDTINADTQPGNALVASADTDDYEYEPLTPSIDDNDSEAPAEPHSIPMEFLDLGHEQDGLGDSVALVDTSPVVPSAGETDTFAETTSPTPPSSLEAVAEEPNANSEPPSLADSAIPAVPAIAAAAAAASIANPFSEAFDQEESVSTEFTDQLAEQNVNSMGVTGDQLDQLSPPNDDLTNSSKYPVVSLANEVSSPPESAPDKPQLDSPPIEYEPVPHAERISSTEHPAGGQAPAFIFLGTNAAKTDDTPAPNSELAPGASASDQDSDAANPIDATSSPTEQTGPATLAGASTDEQKTPSTSTDTDDNESDFHQHNTQQLTADIQQQANEILSSIRVQDPNQTDPIDDEVALTGSQESPADPVASQDNTEISEAQRILAEILEHKQLLNDQMNTPATESSASDMVEFPQSLPIKQPHPNDASGEPNATGNGPEANSPTSHHDAAEAPVSIGRAERMDYEKLFEQLRDKGNQT